MGAEMSPGAERRASNSATNSAPNEKDAQNSSAKAGFEARTPGNGPVGSKIPGGHGRHKCPSAGLQRAK